MNTILLIGADSILLNTRAAVLGKTGSEVVCSDAASALALQEVRQCELVMLCHSLPPEVCVSLAEVIRQRWPKTRILLVEPLKELGRVDLLDLVDAISPPEPERLIGKTMELLGQPGPMDAGDIFVRGAIVRAGPFA